MDTLNRCLLAGNVAEAGGGCAIGESLEPAATAPAEADDNAQRSNVLDISDEAPLLDATTDDAGNVVDPVEACGAVPVSSADVVADGDGRKPLIEAVRELISRRLGRECEPVIVREKPRPLPNCKIVGTHYEASVAELLSKVGELKSLGVALGKNESGIEWSYNPGTGVLSCDPTVAGEFEVELCVDVCRYERHILPLKLTVNPDPRTLWTNIPSNQQECYPKKDSAVEFFACTPGLSIVAASQRGRSHAKDGRPRDDDFAVHYDVANEFAILTVADGAGSAEFSRKGSQIAVQSVLEIVLKEVSPDYWQQLEKDVREWTSTHAEESKKRIESRIYNVLARRAAYESKSRIAQEAKDKNVRTVPRQRQKGAVSTRDFATTLIVALAKKFDFGWFVATYWVGDGAVGVYQPEQSRVRLLCNPDSGEYGGQTRFLTEDSDKVWPQDPQAIIQRRIRFDVVDAFKAIVLMTDGISDPMFETERQLESVASWGALWEELEKQVPFDKRDASVADNLLEWMNFWSQGSHDDRTMVVLY